MTILDTLDIARTLRKAGFSEAQADAIAGAVRNAAAHAAAAAPDLSVLATKVDLTTEVGKVRTEIAQVRTEIVEAKNDVLKWIIGLVVGMLAVNIGAMLTLAKLLALH